MKYTLSKCKRKNGKINVARGAFLLEYSGDYVSKDKGLKSNAACTKRCYTFFYQHNGVELW